jgi:hypothetical protein
MAKELQADYLRSQHSDPDTDPRTTAEIKVLSERIARLRARLRDGDPDLTPDELEAALVRAKDKRQALLKTRPTGDATRVLSRPCRDRTYD